MARKASVHARRLCGHWVREVRPCAIAFAVCHSSSGRANSAGATKKARNQSPKALLVENPQTPDVPNEMDLVPVEQEGFGDEQMDAFMAGGLDSP